MSDIAETATISATIWSVVMISARLGEWLVVLGIKGRCQ
jgi:hypothetical protein